MTSSPSVLPLIQSAVKRQDRHQRQEASNFARMLLQRQSAPSCTFCGLALAVGKTDATALLPPWFGVLPTLDNVVLACRSCVTRKGQLDIIDEAFTKALPQPLPASVLSLRSSMLLKADNHLTPQRRGIERDKLISHLSERHAHPRCRVFACQTDTHGFIGWRERVGNPLALSVLATLLKHSHHARLTQDNGTLVFQLEIEAFLEAVWALIELNTLVEELWVDASVRPSMETDWRHSWRYRSTSLNALRERRTVDGFAPRKPKEASTHPSAVRMRELRHERIQEEETQKRLRAHRVNVLESLRVRAELDAYYEEVGYENADPEVAMAYLRKMARAYYGEIEDFE